MIKDIWMKIDFYANEDDKTIMPGWICSAGSAALNEEGFFEMAVSCFLSPEQLQKIFNVLIETGQITGANPLRRPMPECATMCHTEMSCDACEQIKKIFREEQKK